MAAPTPRIPASNLSVDPKTGQLTEPWQRLFHDTQKAVEDLQARLLASEAAVTDLKARVTALGG